MTRKRRYDYVINAHFSKYLMLLSENMSRDLGESDLPSHAGFPEGLPENLVVRGTGEALAAGLDRMGEDCSTLTGAIALYFDAEQQLEGPQFVLRGPPIEFGVRPKTIWGDVS